MELNAFRPFCHKAPVLVAAAMSTVHAALHGHWSSCVVLSVWSAGSTGGSYGNTGSDTNYLSSDMPSGQSHGSHGHHGSQGYTGSQGQGYGGSEGYTGSQGQLGSHGKQSSNTKGQQYDATGGAVDDRTMMQKGKDALKPGDQVGTHGG